MFKALYIWCSYKYEKKNYKKIQQGWILLHNVESDKYGMRNSLFQRKWEDTCITKGLSHIKEEKVRNFSKLKDARDVTTKYNNRPEADFYTSGKFSLKGEKYCKRF